MKLRNKKTGEIINSGDMYNIMSYDEYQDRIEKEYSYNSLAELNADWEDYEEPKKHHYYIEPRGEVIELVFGDDVDALKEELSEVGNYFETKEEAEKAVEKLKAWQRLKDKGFEFDGWSAGLGKNKIYTIFWSHNDGEFDLRKDLDLLFGGEE